MRILFLFLILSILIGLGINVMAQNENAEIQENCEGRQWKEPGERLDCLYPNPPLGRWYAVYNEEFAEKYNLPEENMSTDLSPGVDYMEMDVQPYNGEMGTACMVNMLVKKPHDIALFNMGNNHFSWAKEFNKKRKLLHFLDIEKYKSQITDITSINFSSRDYAYEKEGFRRTTFAFYVENVLEGYDYIAANAHCRDVSMHPQYFPDGYSLWIAKASVWGRYESLYKSYDDPARPKGSDWYETFLFINIPSELISTVFNDVPIGGSV